MLSIRATRPRSVSTHGAMSACVLRGAGKNNQGLRLRVQQAQTRENDGPIKGSFVILDAGYNLHTESLSTLLHQVTSAEKVAGLIRRQHAACVNVVNANILVLEEDQAARPTSVTME
jgi:hypothetical protein